MSAHWSARAKECATSARATERLPSAHSSGGEDSIKIVVIVTAGEDMQEAKQML
jgi:hypothetical protein